MNKFTRFTLYFVMALILYFAAYFTIASAYPETDSNLPPVADTLSVEPDTLVADSLMGIDTTDELITNEDIVSAGAESSMDAKEQTEPKQTQIVTQKPAAADKSTQTKITPSRSADTKVPDSKTKTVKSDDRTVVIQKDAAKAKKETNAKPDIQSQKTEVVRKKATESGSTAGKYKVMAGTYLVRENAQKMVDRLRAMGYTRAEIVPKEKMFAVIAAAFDTEARAREVSEELKRKQIDSFVKAK